MTTVTMRPGAPPREGKGDAGDGGSDSEETGPFASAALPILRAAADQVATDWHQAAGDALDPSEVVRELGWLLEALESETAPDGPAAETTSDLLLRRRLLELLRAETVRLWAGADISPDADEMLAVLGAFERLRAALEPAWDQQFTSRLSAPSGLDLVVEVAHDLRSPLTSILFLSETLRREQSGRVNDVQRRQLGIIYSAALALTSVAGDVIELARGGDQLVDPQPSPLSIAEILQSVYDIVQPMAEEKGLDVRLLPPTTDQRLGYPVALSRVLLNLTTNALKFTDEGSVDLVVSTHGINRLEFSVKDTGRGINPDVMTTLYQPFRRTRARNGYYFSGSGLGLAICRKLVEAMGARLEVETEAGRGTRFYFELELPPAEAL